MASRRFFEKILACIGANKVPYKIDFLFSNLNPESCDETQA